MPAVAAERQRRAQTIEEMLFDTCDQYTLQADAFGRAILEDTPVPTPLADAVANMRVIERIFTSAERRLGVVPGPSEEASGD